jgi:hypothetical protein
LASVEIRLSLLLINLLDYYVTLPLMGSLFISLIMVLVAIKLYKVDLAVNLSFIVIKVLINKQTVEAC